MKENEVTTDIIDEEAINALERANPKEEKKNSLKKEILLFLLDLVVVFIVVFLILHFVGIKTSVIGSSMYPTLKNGDHLIVDKLSYRLRDPKRYEIIVFDSGKKTSGKEKYYIKRIIGLPGDTVEIFDGKVFVNDEEIENKYAHGQLTYEDGSVSYPLVLEKNEYFVLGDNRAGSSDSRSSSVGVVKRSKIVGRAILRIYPFKSFGGLD